MDNLENNQDGETTGILTVVMTERRLMALVALAKAYGVAPNELVAEILNPDLVASLLGLELTAEFLQ